MAGLKLLQKTLVGPAGLTVSSNIKHLDFDETAGQGSSPQCLSQTAVSLEWPPDTPEMQSPAAANGRASAKQMLQGLDGAEPSKYSPLESLSSGACTFQRVRP